MTINTDTVRVLAISGSLRKASSNSALVSAAVRVAPVGVEVSVYGELAEVPPFNPDLDTDTTGDGLDETSPIEVDALVDQCLGSSRATRCSPIATVHPLSPLC